MQSRLDSVLEDCRRELISVQELTRETEGVSIQGFCCKETRVIMWNRTKAKHNQEQVVKSIQAGQLSVQRGLQGTMEPLKEAVETRSSGTCNVQEGAQNLPDEGCELCPTVQGHLSWNPNSGDPTRDESSYTISSRDGG